jgi:O-antigen/teichoic acid export membrane protein
MRDKIRGWYADNLFRNSFYLMFNTAIQATLGFFFWLICAHLFTPDQIGIATSLISAMTLISYISLLGFNNTFVRILPTSKEKSNDINTGALLVIILAAVLSVMYLLIVPIIAPKLIIIDRNFWYGAAFVVMVGLSSINLLTDSIFVAFRAAQYCLITDAFITSGFKLVLPLVFVGLGAYGIFAASGLAASIGMVASIIFLVTQFGYKPELRIHKKTIKGVFNYSFYNYIANLLNIAPTLILPLLVLDHLGSAEAGYYYLAFSVANLLYAVAFAVSQSFFAEGSYGETQLKHLLKKALLILGAIMVPAGVILATLGGFVLHFFGKSYSAGGGEVIVILALAAPAVAAYTLGNAALRIRSQIYSIIVVNVIYFLAIGGLALLWVHRGLTWVAIAWVIGNLAAALVAFFAIAYFRPGHTVRTAVV